MVRLIFCLFLFLSTLLQAQSLHFRSLKVEQQEQPVGIIRTNPRFSWVLQSDQPSFQQTAYQIQVASDSVNLMKGLTLQWNSQKVVSASSQWLRYQGKTLLSGQTYYWRVKVWDIHGKASAWSAIRSFQMGLRSATDWEGAVWISDAQLPDSLVVFPYEHGKGEKARALKRNTLPLLRRAFMVDKPIRRATVFMSGLGQFDLYLNGAKVSQHFSDQAWTHFQQEIHYVSFDVTSQLKHGSNVIGVMLGNGFTYIPAERYRKMTGAWSYPKLIGLVKMEYADGTLDFIPTDQRWQTHPGPITFSSVYAGEEYDATLSVSNWCNVLHDSAAWKHALQLPTNYAILKPQIAPSLEVKDTMNVKESWSVFAGSATVYDMGQNASGVPFIQVRGHRGDTIRITPGELLNEKKEVSQKATGSPVYYQYIMGSDRIETWHPQFSFYGFRYLQVQSFPKGQQRPALLQLQALHTRSAVLKAGSFTCDLPLFNQTNDLILWAIKSNLASVLMDCPHREKIGWMEQCYLMGNSIRHNFDMLSYFRKSLHDMSLEQDSRGALPEYAPEYVKMDFMEGIFRESPEWGSVAVILPWYLYEWYGDIELLREHYTVMKKYTNYLGTRAQQGIISFGLSDWYDVGPNRSGLTQQTPMGLTATATYYYDLMIMQQVAKKLGDTRGAASYKAQSLIVKKAFHEKFYDRERTWYGTGSQTAQAMALYMHLVPDSLRQEVMRGLLNDLEERKFAITTGDIGFRYLLKVLEEAGRSDIIFKMNNRTDVPGYGYQITQGATALTESWMASPLVSNNHLMLGHLMEWFYTSLLGIRQEHGSVGYQKILLAPTLVGDLSHASGHYEAPLGTIFSSWRKDAHRFTWNIQIPGNASARLVLPFKKWDRILLNQKEVKLDALMRLGSGEYEIVVEF